MQDALIQLDNIRVQYGNLVALNGISLKVNRNEVLGLLGDSGAGKSTLARVIAGTVRPSSGTVYSDGKITAFQSAADSRAAGIEVAHENFGLVDSMSVCRNFFVGHELRRSCWPVLGLARRQMETTTAAALASAGLTDITPGQMVGSLSVSEKRLLSISRASYFCTRLLVLDEPLARLSEAETGVVLRIVQEARRNGVSVLFITHNEHEVFDIADRFVILNEGRNYTEVMRDDTNSKELEKLVISTRLSTVREMTAEVAHQIRNPLAVMKVSAEMLRDDFSVGSRKEDYRRITAMLLGEINALSALMQNFLSFARLRKIDRCQCSVGDMINSAIESLPLGDFRDVKIVAKIAPGLSTYSMDQDLMTQAVAILLMNALQASPAGVKVEVRAFLAENLLHIEVQDWGCGIDDEIRRKLFVPFFTTKTKGVGLGLSIAKRIVEEHGGGVDTIPDRRDGTTFRIVL